MAAVNVENKIQKEGYLTFYNSLLKDIIMRRG